MALSARFSLLSARFDPFLFASIGRQENDMPLSVASALARLGADPWAEAERLAQLPRELATEALAATIERMSTPRVGPFDAPRIAARLILLLPDVADGPVVRPSDPAEPPRRRFGGITLLLCLAFVAFASLTLLTERRQDVSPPAITTLTP
jgi:hypothetical protein